MYGHCRRPQGQSEIRANGGAVTRTQTRNPKSAENQREIAVGYTLVCVAVCGVCVGVVVAMGQNSAVGNANSRAGQMEKQQSRLKSQQDIKRMRGNKNKRKQTNKQTNTETARQADRQTDGFSNWMQDAAAHTVKDEGVRVGVGEGKGVGEGYTVPGTGRNLLSGWSALLCESLPVQRDGDGDGDGKGGDGYVSLGSKYKYSSAHTSQLV